MNNPFEKYSSKWESSPSFGVKIKNVWNHHPDCHSKMNTLQYMESVHYFMIFCLLDWCILFFRWAPALLPHLFANSHNKAGSKEQPIKKNTVAIQDQPTRDVCPRTMNYWPGNTTCHTFFVTNISQQILFQDSSGIKTGFKFKDHPKTHQLI